MRFVELILLTLLIAPACGQEVVTNVDPLSCGDGTEEKDGSCVPIQSLECGPGTVEKDGSCQPESTLVCGEGTKREGGACVPEPTVLPCGEGTLSTGGECVADPDAVCGLGTHYKDGSCQNEEVAWLHMPVPAGSFLSLSQGIATHHTHKARSRYALDLPMDEGTELVAPADGRVLRTRSDSDTGCDDPACGGDSNYVQIQLKDGLIVEYAHLLYNGVFVEPGDVVCRGEVIALSGNTGYSSGPHLHMEAQNFYRETVPIYFYELEPFSGGQPMYGITLQSENELVEGCEEIPFAECPQDLFLHRGVSLDGGLPCRAAKPNTDYVVNGTSLAQGMWVQFAILGPEDESFSSVCHPVLPDGSFEFTVHWPGGDPRLHYFMLGTAHDNCVSYYGWEHSPGVALFENAD